MCAVVTDRHDADKLYCVRCSNKRKFDDYVLDRSDQCQVRMRKDSISSVDDGLGLVLGPSWVKNQDRNPIFISGTLQFFIRGFGRSLVFRAWPGETVDEVCGRIERLEGIPKLEQRLIYCGRQLQGERTLKECGVMNDSCLYLTGRMRSMEYSRSWVICNDIVSMANSIRHGRPFPFCRSGELRSLETLVKIFLLMTKKDDKERAWGHLQVFILSGASTALVVLYAWKPNCCLPDHGHRSWAKRSIQLFLERNEHMPGSVHLLCAPILLEFCKLLLGAVGSGDSFYLMCRRSFANLLESSGFLNDPKHFAPPRSVSVINELLPFVEQLKNVLSAELSRILMSKVLPDNMSSLSDYLSEFSKFLVPLQAVIQDQFGWVFPISMANICKSQRNTRSDECLGFLYHIFENLLGKVDRCLTLVEETIVKVPGGLSENQLLSWSFFLFLLKELDEISKVYDGAGEKLHSVLLARRVSLNALIRGAKRTCNLWWLLKHKDVTNFEARRNLVMMMFPEERDDYEELHEMLIDRSHILAESFGYIAHADTYSLQAGLFMEFKNEEATGPGVLREWFCLLCQEIFNPRNVLFLPCPSDRRRFFPNPKSSVDPLHLQYFGFCGRIIALALAHNVQVGILLDRAFFLQLAGRHISLEDVQDADPTLYKSCRHILEMNADVLDSDTLGLTFAREIDEMGTLRIVELCSGGQHIVVNSKNRQNYVDLLIQHHFVTSISQQVAHFSKGFGDILSNSDMQRSFFHSLDLEDFDKMLGGSEKAICVRDWKAHTEYNGYKEKDRQIKWFWKVVERMSMEERRTLVIFWTAVRHLPSDGFGGLNSKLYIHKSSDSEDHLPTSHTCFYQICLPAYKSMSIMRARLHFVAQQHVSGSFGIW